MNTTGRVKRSGVSRVQLVKLEVSLPELLTGRMWCHAFVPRLHSFPPPSGPGTRVARTSPPPTGPGTRVARTSPPPSGPGTRVARTSPPPSGPGTRVARTSPPPSGPGTRVARTSPVPMQNPVVDGAICTKNSDFVSVSGLSNGCYHKSCCNRKCLFRLA